MQCLADDPLSLSKRLAFQAISSTLSSLSVYARALPSVLPFLRFFEELANRYMDRDGTLSVGSDFPLRGVLRQVVMSDPAELPEYDPFRSFTDRHFTHVELGCYSNS